MSYNPLMEMARIVDNIGGSDEPSESDRVSPVPFAQASESEPTQFPQDDARASTQFPQAVHGGADAPTQFRQGRPAWHPQADQVDVNAPTQFRQVHTAPFPQAGQVNPPPFLQAGQVNSAPFSQVRQVNPPPSLQAGQVNPASFSQAGQANVRASTQLNPGGQIAPRQTSKGRRTKFAQGESTPLHPEQHTRHRVIQTQSSKGKRKTQVHGVDQQHNEEDLIQNLQHQPIDNLNATAIGISGDGLINQLKNDVSAIFGHAGGIFGHVGGIFKCFRNIVYSLFASIIPFQIPQHR